ADASTAWKAIMPDGSLVDPGTAGTLRFNANCGIGTTVVTEGAPSKAFSGIAAADGIVLPEIIYELLLAPKEGITNYGNFWINLEGERVPFRGGSYNNTSHAGSSALNLRHVRSDAYGPLGFFSAYQE
ncbi:hypothetical protein, partial [Bacteroides heparinolyticus]|uniref:hypothetical protein n=1 Tax=Prevotella heparinolytica TaxID=28113 RepID=UPI00359F7262